MYELVKNNSVNNLIQIKTHDHSYGTRKKNRLIIPTSRTAFTLTHFLQLQLNSGMIYPFL